MEASSYTIDACATVCFLGIGVARCSSLTTLPGRLVTTRKLVAIARCAAPRGASVPGISTWSCSSDSRCCGRCSLLSDRLCRRRRRRILVAIIVGWDGGSICHCDGNSKDGHGCELHDSKCC